jgi:hypothetical protein
MGLSLEEIDLWHPFLTIALAKAPSQPRQFALVSALRVEC